MVEFDPATRQAVMARDGHQCVALLAPGVRCADGPLEVDHLIGVAEAITLGWTPQQITDPANAATLCTAHHREKTRDDTRRGQQRWQQRRPKRRRPAQRHPGLIE